MIIIENSKLAETLTELVNKMKNDEVIDFEYSDPFNETKKGKITKTEDKIKIELPENSYSNIVVNGLANPGLIMTLQKMF